MKYQFKNEMFGDDWQDWDEPRFGKEPWDEERAAEMIAEELYNEEPSDPDRFEFEVEIKSKAGIKKFTVGARLSVDFYGKEINND